MPHLHLSLQSGSDLVLKRMRRRHSRAQALSLIARARRLRPGLAIGADLIAGFPTETEALADETERFVSEAEIPYLHVFPYSERPGTPAARMPAVPVPIRRERAARLRDVASGHAARFHRAQLGQTVSVLAERGGRGHTQHFTPRPLGCAGWRAGAGTGDGRRRLWITGGGGLMALGGFFNKLKAGLTRSTEKLTSGITAAFVKRTLDDTALEELEELLLGADLGPAAASDIVENFRKSRFGRSVTDAEIKDALAEEIAAILEPVAKPLVLDRSRKPHVILVVGVNGTGKTTTIGKLALQYREEGLRAVMVAGDTFRAAAVEQLQIWGDRTGAPVISGPPNADAAGLVFDALTRARAEAADVLLIDTAGRLHNKSALMEELSKIIRVMRRQDPSAPHSVLLVLDATTGHNALEQVRVFKEMVAVTGLIVTKLDGSARGGIVVALAEELRVAGACRGGGRTGGRPAAV